MTTMAMVSADTASGRRRRHGRRHRARRPQDAEKQQLLSTFKLKAKDKETGARRRRRRAPTPRRSTRTRPRIRPGRPPTWRLAAKADKPKTKETAGAAHGAAQKIQAERLGRVVLESPRRTPTRWPSKCGNVTKDGLKRLAVGRRGGEDDVDEHVRGDEEEAEVEDRRQPRQARRHQEARAQGVQQARNRVDEGDGDVIGRSAAAARRRRPRSARSRARRSPLTRSRARWRRRRASPRPRTTRRAAKSRWPNTRR